MTHKHNGGPAFPLPVADQECFGRFESGYGGMSLRAYFAAKAMQGLLANPSGPIQANGMSGWGWCNCSPEDVINLAYMLADAAMAKQADTIQLVGEEEQ